MIRDAIAQTLQPVTDGGINWWPMAIGAVLIVAVVGLVVWFNRTRGQESASVPTANSELTAAIAGAHDLMRQLVAKMGTPESSSIEVATVVGKANQPGTFTIEVTGNPATDMAAINAQYFG